MRSGGIRGPCPSGQRLFPFGVRHNGRRFFVDGNVLTSAVRPDFPEDENGGWLPRLDSN
jgi:hypothetical protein